MKKRKNQRKGSGKPISRAKVSVTEAFLPEHFDAIESKNIDEIFGVKFLLEGGTPHPEQEGEVVYEQITIVANHDYDQTAIDIAGARIQSLYHYKELKAICEPMPLRKAS